MHAAKGERCAPGDAGAPNEKLPPPPAPPTDAGAAPKANTGAVWGAPNGYAPPATGGAAAAAPPKTGAPVAPKPNVDGLAVDAAGAIANGFTAAGAEPGNSCAVAPLVAGARDQLGAKVLGAALPPNTGAATADATADDELTSVGCTTALPKSPSATPPKGEVAPGVASLVARGDACAAPARAGAAVVPVDIAGQALGNCMAADAALLNGRGAATRGEEMVGIGAVPLPTWVLCRAGSVAWVFGVVLSASGVCAAVARKRPSGITGSRGRSVQAGDGVEGAAPVA
jgi:hypothetical protein